MDLPSADHGVLHSLHQLPGSFHRLPDSFQDTLRHGGTACGPSDLVTSLPPPMWDSTESVLPIDAAGAAACSDQ